MGKSLGIWGNSSSESDESEYPGDASMLAIKDDEDVYNSIISFMAKYDEEDEGDDEVILDDLKQNLDICSLKTLRKSVVVFIDSLCELTTKRGF